MRIRPVHIWWLGVILFTPSVLTWIIVTSVLLYQQGGFELSSLVDWNCLKYGYIPMFAAAVGVALPLVCLRRLRRAAWRVTAWAFAGYLSVMLIWGIVDIRLEHYQIGGHSAPNGPLVDGHTGYFHVYFTWYFLPYAWIERGVK